MPAITMPSPIGPLSLTEQAGRLVALDVAATAESDDIETPLLREARRQLAAYFSGRLHEFDLPLAPAGSRFDLEVWRAIRAIPYGQTRSYGEIAHEAHSAPRAVGGACGRNPIAIIVPCHRVLASGGIGGYGSAGIAAKRFLLELERETLQKLRRPRRGEPSRRRRAAAVP